MILRLDFASHIPIYRQIRNQIVQGIAQGTLAPGEKLPTIRALADEAGINMMTVSKAYQLLKQEGYILSDRRSGAIVNDHLEKPKGLSDKSMELLKVILSEARLNGISNQEFFEICDRIYSNSD